MRDFEYDFRKCSVSARAAGGKALEPCEPHESAIALTFRKEEIGRSSLMANLMLVCPMINDMVRLKSGTLVHVYGIVGVPHPI
jgi:hypothetical protein